MYRKKGAYRPLLLFLGEEIMSKTNLVLVLAVAAATLVGCRDRETPLTGSYGSNLLTGEVVMAKGGSPSGVEVSVSGTGMTLTVGEAGRFTFFGVPSNAELQFRRAADGIDATLRVEPSSAPVIVELSNQGAVRGRRRGAGRSLEYEGTIREKGESTLTIFTSHRTEVVVAVNDDTVIRKGNTTFTFEELEVDWRVHVKAFDLEGVLTAREVMVQNMGEDDADDGDDDPEATMTANGTVLSNEGGTIVVRTSAHGDVTVQTDGSTLIRRQGEVVTVDEIEVDWEINSMGSRVDDTTLLARQIEVRGNYKRPNR
jgi:hypothetical protein